MSALKNLKIHAVERHDVLGNGLAFVTYTFNGRTVEADCFRQAVLGIWGHGNYPSLTAEQQEELNSALDAALAQYDAERGAK